MLFMTSALYAGEGMRCGSKLVMEGDSREKARRLCGEPAEIVRSEILRQPSYVRNGQVTYFGNQLVETHVETWTFNFGPNKLMRRVRFVDDRIESIETLGYGHHPIGSP
jgi:hypothetical protein